MQLDDAEVAEFQNLYEGVYGEALTADRAREIAQRLLRLYQLLLRPLPPDD